MRVLICGGRDFSNVTLLYEVLSRLKRVEQIDCIIEGDARGADRIAGYWARKNKIDNIKFPADWKTFKKAAGPIRNSKMIEDGKPDLVIALSGGVGTADLIAKAKKAGIDVREIPADITLDGLYAV